MSILTKLRTKKLFFPVTQTPLKAVIKGKEIDAPEYMSMHHKFNFLGVQPKQENSDRVFCLEHKQVYRCAAMVARVIDPALVWYLSYASHNLNQAFTLFGREEFEESKQHQDNNKGESETNIYPPNYIIDDLEITRKKLEAAGFRPTIVAENGFDYLHRTVFYVLVELPITSKSKGYLTLARYRFSQKTVNRIIQNPAQALSLAFEALQAECIPKFIKALETFSDRYDKLSEIQTVPNILTAVTLDIFDRNRNVQTLSSDDRMRLNLWDFIKEASKFYRGEEVMNALVSFVIRRQVIDLSEPYVSLADFRAILTEEKRVQKLKTCLQR